MFAIVMCLVVLICTLTMTLYVVCINARSYVCCCYCYVASNDCDDPTSCLVQPIGAHGCEDMYLKLNTLIFS